MPQGLFARVAIFIMVLSALVTGCRTRKPVSKINAKANKEQGIRLTSASEVLPSGEYFGYTKASDSAAKIATVVSIIADAQGKKQVLFKLVLGGFSGAEYVSDRFMESRSDRTTEYVQLDGGNHFLMTDVKSPAEKMITAKLLDLQNKSLGDVVLLNSSLKKDDLVKHLSFIFEGAAEVPALTGLYSGQCNGKETILQLESTRWGRHDGEDRHLMQDYKITGRAGRVDQSICGTADIKCIKSIITDGEYDFFSGRLQLRGKPADRLCSVSGYELTCDQCRLTKTLGFSQAINDLESSLSRSKRMNSSSVKIEKVSKVDDGQAQPGEFYGFLHHENTNRYQLVRLRMQKNDGQMLAVATLFFGAADANEFIAYRFDPQSWPAKPENTIVDGSGEAFFQIKRWSWQTIGGTWYSKSYGRVGVFELSRDRLPALTANMQMLGKLSGDFGDGTHSLALKVDANVSERRDDFYPPLISGTFKDSGTSLAAVVYAGVFDYYTGQVALELNNGRMLLGDIANGTWNVFSTPTPKLGTLMTDVPERLFMGLHVSAGTARNESRP